MKKILVLPIVIALVLALGAGAVLAYVAWTGTANVNVLEALNISWAAAPDKSLDLEDKDANWVEISGGMSGVLTYNVAGATFDYTLEASGLTPDQEYRLIYYADTVDRYVDWGGDNPGALIRTVSADGSGNIDVIGSRALNMNLPSTPDANINVHDYTTEYGTAHGAKIWLVPSSCYNASTVTVTSWQPTTFLFEMDLIAYRYSTTAGMVFAGNQVTVTDLMPGETWNIEITIENLSTASISVTLTPNDPYAEVRMDVGAGSGNAKTVTVSGLGTVSIAGSITASQSATPGGPYNFTVAVSR